MAPPPPTNPRPPTPLTGPAPAVGEVQAPQPTDDLPVHLQIESKGTMGAAPWHGAPHAGDPWPWEHPPVKPHTDPPGSSLLGRVRH